MANIRIKNLTLAMIMALTLITGWMIMGLWSAYHDHRHAMGHERFASAIVTAAFRLTSLTGDYMIYHQPRARDQWRSTHRSLGELLQNKDFGHIDINPEIIQIHHSHETAGRLFARLSRDSAQNQNGVFSTVLEKRLFDTLLTVNQEMVSNASLVETRNRQTIEGANDRIKKLVMGILLVFGAIIAVISLILMRRVVSPLRTLVNGIEYFGGGELDHRLKILRHDEIGDVATAFNSMADRLQESLVSRDEMAKEVIERKRAQQQMAEKSTLLESTINSMAQGCIVYDSSLRVAAFNAQYEEMFDFPPGFLHPGLHLEDIIRHRRSRPVERSGNIEIEIKQRLERVTKRGERNEERNLPNGTTYIYHRMPMADGGFITTYTDITERKKAAQHTLEQSLILRTTFENMDQGISVYDAQHTLLAANALHGEILGLPPGFVKIGMNRSDIIRHRAEQGHYGECDIEAVIAEKMAMANKGASGEHMSPNGRFYAHEHIPTPDGGYISTARDITDRRLAEKKLQQAQKMEAVGQLTGGIAHDFNNLLAISMGNLELAKADAQHSGHIEPFLGTAIHANERGAELTNQLLAFSRQQTLMPKIINAGTLLNDMTSLLRSSLGETIKIEFTQEESLWLCKVDPHQLESAILNLAINARDAMPDGGVLTIQTTNCQDIRDDEATGAVSGDYVMVSVTDTGCGMSQHSIDHAFDPFFTTKKVGEGSGLGLSMVYGFVTQSGGHVTVDSAAGKGTTVKLFLPRSTSAEYKTSKGHDEEIPRALGETILVVEDDPDLRTLSETLLTGLGYTVFGAEDGKSAIELFEKMSKIDLLFTDVVLPGGTNGPEIAAEIKKRKPTIKVLYTSGYTDLANIDQSTFKEGVDLLQKPYRKAALAKMVRQVLEQA
ncbi:MAG: response regulator [Rhodospirillales bacterium]|nr:response regulator [Rhodospirillales bacterium]MBT4006413.1 response regulator [Rhodospirillales bacterium]MBT5114290.1 response regulator [Rhodospirillales bacterium]MBT6186665.1 response regulator [Rhodospirillales bacterium]MBT6742186.1 response regulator [Rhodospirillales bacterium]